MSLGCPAIAAAAAAAAEGRVTAAEAGEEATITLGATPTAGNG